MRYALSSWQRDPRMRWVALVLLAAVLLPLATTRLHAGDEIEFFAYLRSLWFDRDVSFDNEYRYFYDRGIATGARPRDSGIGLVGDGFHEMFLVEETVTGLRHNFGTIGSAILWSPFYAVADVVARLLRAFGAPVAVDGYSGPYLAAVAYGSAVYGFLAICLSIFSTRRLLGEGHLAGLAVWIGTPLLFYAYVAPGFSHACSAFAVALFVTVWLIVREHWSLRGLTALGACAGLMAMVREQDMFFVVGPAIDFVWSLGEALRRRRSGHARILLARLAAGSAVAFVCYLPQVVVYITLYGRIGPSPVVAGKMVWHAPYAASVLLSPEYGVFIWTPLAVVALAGLGWFAATGAWRLDSARALRIGVCLFAMFAAQVYISGSVEGWAVPGSFGQRRFVGTTIILVIGVAAALAGARQRAARNAVAAVVVLCTWWSLGLLIQFGSGMMDRRHLDPVRDIYRSFVVVPRVVPAVMYRYLFDRSSFYHAPDRYEEPPAP